MRILWVLLVAAVLAGGCGKKAEPVRSVKVVKDTGAQTASALAARLEAAGQISGSSQRDEALEKVATDAAAAKDADIVKRAVNIIMASASKDRSAEACALALAKQGDVKAAGEVAQMISATSARDRTLAAIAKGEK